MVFFGVACKQRRSPGAFACYISAGRDRRELLPCCLNRPDGEEPATERRRQARPGSSTDDGIERDADGRRRMTTRGSNHHFCAITCGARSPPIRASSRYQLAGRPSQPASHQAARRPDNDDGVDRCHPGLAVEVEIVLATAIDGRKRG